MLLHKYLSAQSLILFLRTGKIRVQSPYSWNDPFEMSVFDLNYFEPTLHHSIRDMSIISYKQRLGILSYDDAKKYDDDNTFSNFSKHQLIDNNIVALSLSNVKDNLLMWAHYADNNMGCVLEFDTNDDFFTKHKFLFKIKYGLQRHSRSIQDDCTFLSQVANELNGKTVNEKTIDEFRDYSIKSIDWKYEDEWRIICNKHICFEQKGMILMDIPLHLVSAIYMGCRITPENAKQIFSITKDNVQLNKTKIVQAKLNESQFYFDFSEFSITDFLTPFEQELCFKDHISRRHKLFLWLFKKNSILLNNKVFVYIQPPVCESLIQKYKDENTKDESQIKEFRLLYEMSQQKKILKKDFKE